MLNDQLAGRPLELDAIAGPILRALGVSGAPITAAAVHEILILRDARSSLALGGNAISERPLPLAGEVAGGVAVGRRASSTVGNADRAIGRGLMICGSVGVASVT